MNKLKILFALGIVILSASSLAKNFEAPNYMDRVHIGFTDDDDKDTLLLTICKSVDCKTQLIYKHDSNSLRKTIFVRNKNIFQNRYKKTLNKQINSLIKASQGKSSNEVVDVIYLGISFGTSPVFSREEAIPAIKFFQQKYENVFNRSYSFDALKYEADERTKLRQSQSSFMQTLKHSQSVFNIYKDWLSGELY